MKKYLHVCPPWYLFYGENNLRQPSTPLGAAYCARAALSVGWQANIWNGDLQPVGGDARYSEGMSGYQGYLVNQSRDEHPVWGEFRAVLRAYQPDVVGITVLSPSYPSGVRVARLVKEVVPQCKVVMGGPHANALPHEVVADSDVDAVVVGEGEGPLKQLLNAWHQAQSIVGLPGVVTQLPDGEVVSGPSAPMVKCLDELGWPAKGVVYDHHGLLERDNYGLVMYARGCPYKCEFCASPALWSNRTRWRSPADMAMEMLAIHKEYDTRYFSFEDDTFTLNRRRTVELMNEIIKLGLPDVPGFRWTCNTRPDRVDPELLALMKRAGCAAVAVGIEFGNKHMLEKMRKDFTVDDVRAAVRMIKEIDMISSGQFLVGLPTETPEDMWETVALADELEVDSVMLSVATPLPATPLYNEALQLGLIPEQGIDWAAVTTKNDGILMTVEQDGEHRPMPLAQRKALVADLHEAINKIQARTLARRNSRRSWYESQYVPEEEVKAKVVTPIYGIQKVS